MEITHAASLACFVRKYYPAGNKLFVSTLQVYGQIDRFCFSPISRAQVYLNISYRYFSTPLPVEALPYIVFCLTHLYIIFLSFRSVLTRAARLRERPVSEKGLGHV
ncbi:hypothetical protein H2248_012567 [Termitomyces sp. 'cryptogamus']|nr:hypothetical protein H2248_012567 [Termitomyces sp. 'cryptogamus']